VSVEHQRVYINTLLKWKHASSVYEHW
jgi:hypothetical protein